MRKCVCVVLANGKQRREVRLIPMWGKKAAFEVEGQLDNKSSSRESEERVHGE